MRVLGVIPARGGSKRVERKNLRLLQGSPLIAYTIRAAQAAKRLTDWVVSTDDQEIANVALSYGAHVHHRSKMDDRHTSGKACLDALNAMEIDDEPYDMVVLLHPTSPIRDPRHIDEAVETLAASPGEYLASVCRLPKKAHGNVGPRVGHNVVLAAGDQFILNASIYAMKREWLVKTGEHVGRTPIPLVMDRFHSLDIDEEIDLDIAELYLNANKQS